MSAATNTCHSLLGDVFESVAEYLSPHTSTHRPLDLHKLPSRPAEPRWQTPQTNSRILPTYARPGSPWLAAQDTLDPAYVTQVAAGSDALVAQVLPKTSGLPTTTTAADLAPTEDVQITQEIRDLATELNNDPVKIYEYVRNTIDFEPTWGSIKGSVLTLWEKSGNAFDTASLLIALFRAANIPARYVLGTIQVPAAQAQNWVGGVTTPHIAATVLASGGVPTSYNATSVTLEHVWVEAYVPMAHYRGVPLGQTGKTWIPLDASVKSYNISPRPDIAATVPFNASAYLGAPTTVDPVRQYQADLVAVLVQEDPEATIDEARERTEIAPLELGLLLSTLPAKAVAVRAEYADLPSALRHSLRFAIQNPSDPAVLATKTVSLPAIAGKRVTVSYQPASAADEATVAAYGGFLYDVPAYLLHVRPILRLDGTTVLNGASMLLGTEHDVVMDLVPPGGPVLSVSKQMTAGAYYAVPLAFSRTLAAQPGSKNGRLIATLQTGDPALVGHDELIGEHLAALADTYFLIDTRAKASAGELYRVVQWRQPAIATCAFSVATTEVFGVPSTVRPAGMEFDVRINPMIAVSRTGDPTRVRQFMDLTGLAGSFWEHSLFESIHGFPSVSAVKALQAAYGAGIPVHQVTPANAAAILPLLQVPDSVLADVQNAIAAGFEVQVPEDDIQMDDWFGVGYVIRDPASGASTYRISGGLNGSRTINASTGTAVIGMLRGPFVWLLNALEDLWRRYIATGATAALGSNVEDLIVAGARFKLGVSYDEAGKCTGLAIYAHAIAGIPLQTLAIENGIGDVRNVSNLYLLVKKRPEWFAQLPDHARGDMPFFRNTYDRAASMTRPNDDGVTHVGIVVEKTGVTTVSFVHAAGSRMRDPITKQVIYNPDGRPKLKGVVEEIGIELDRNAPNLIGPSKYWAPRLLGFGRPRY